ncbi:AAA family ATPase [Acetobacter fabarum]|uniref:ATP-dependent nuclease n=1 Tax=Acetobacter fabarum TaxID=483199 RepID=UPI001404A0AC|nr:AAA family ATPase [Acetobacter fabarum]NHO43182.1 AAA family ATPase [Acetobacter fabarum]
MENQNNQPNAEAYTGRPSLYFDTITFSDGTILSLDEEDIIVFVGPNNAGKSAALRELEEWVARSRPGTVVKNANLKKNGTSKELRHFLENNSQKTKVSNGFNFGGFGYNIHESHINWFDQSTDRHPVASFFAKRLATETRIQGSNAAPAIPLFQTPPTNPIHLLLMDENLTNNISQKFNAAFGIDLIPFRAGGSEFPLYVGKKPEIPKGKDELSREFVDSLKNDCVRLDQQGDGMRSFATVLLNTIGSDTHSIQFLDEPEAFLHPPQAKLLGKYIAEGRRDKSQLFIATHSTDILDGLLEGSSGKVRIVRIRRSENINIIKELGKEKTSSISKDTLIRFSRVFEGIFFERVFICESDADCMLYSSILNLQSITGEKKPDVLFVHAAGKHRMGKMAETLQALDVPLSIIADIDILNEEDTFRSLIEKTGGDWTNVQPHWKVIADFVNSKRPALNASQISGLIRSEIDGIEGVGEFPPKKVRGIKSILRDISPWSSLKQSGRLALPGGEVVSHFDNLLEKCSEIGIWIVPVGEIEGFCRSIGSHGPGFVEKVIEEKDLQSDPELQDLRDFIMKIWKGDK